MSRTIQIGDIIILSIPNQGDLYYTINNINHNEIKGFNSDNLIKSISLIPSNGTWIVKDNITDYNIEIIAPPLVTNIPEVDFKILLYLDNKTLNAICRANTYINSLCNDEYFWDQKLEKEFPDINIPDDYQGSLKQLYINQIDYLDINSILKEIEKIFNSFLLPNNNGIASQKEVDDVIERLNQYYKSHSELNNNSTDIINRLQDLYQIGKLIPSLTIGGYIRYKYNTYGKREIKIIYPQYIKDFKKTFNIQ